MVRTAKLVALIILSIALLACGAIPVPIGAKQSTRTELDTLDQMIGYPSGTVLNVLSSPIKHFTLQDQEFMLYTKFVSNNKVDVMFIIYPLAPVSKKTPTGTRSIRCTMIEIDSDDLVKNYTIKYVSPKGESYVTKCLKRFFDEWELEYIVSVSPAVGGAYFRPDGSLTVAPRIPSKNTPEIETSQPVCVVDDESWKAINRAWDQEGVTLEALDLLDQAEAAAAPPICDSQKAKKLADKAYQLILDSRP